MSNMFDVYDQEFNTQCQDIIVNISECRDCAPSEKDRALTIIRNLESQLSGAADLIKQMELEVRSHDMSTRKALNEKITQYKKALMTHRSDFERVKEQADRSLLMTSTGKSVEHRGKYLDTNDKLQRQNEMIANAQRTVADTEDVGFEITSELTRNREKINTSRAKAMDFGGATDSARRILASMNRREFVQKMIIGLFVIVLIIIIIVAVYFTQVKKK